VHLLLASGVNGEGYKEILGLQSASAEDKAAWLAFFRHWSPAACPACS
jgi:transposase-like protein